MVRLLSLLLVSCLVGCHGPGPTSDPPTCAQRDDDGDGWSACDDCGPFSPGTTLDLDLLEEDAWFFEDPGIGGISRSTPVGDVDGDGTTDQILGGDESLYLIHGGDPSRL